MPSFTRRTPTAASRPAPLGTIPSLSATVPPLYLLPTGISSFDDLFAGGVPLGGIWAIQSPDRHTAWSRLLSRYWVAQGLSTGQKSVVVGDETTCREVVRRCMWIKESAGGDGSESEGELALGEGLGEGKGGTRIAWRYERMKRFQTTVKGSGRELNLLTPIPGDLLDHMEKTGVQGYIPLTPATQAGSSTSTPGWIVLRDTLGRIAKSIEGLDSKTALRITITDLGSVDWCSPHAQEITRFLHSLRGLIVGKNVGVLVTFPSEICRAPPVGCGDIATWTSNLGWMVDALIELKGFGDEPTLPPLFHPLHGLLSLPKLPTTHHLLPPSYKHSTLLGLAGSSGGGAGENNLGFRLKRKRFVVETVHLGIEGGTGERRTEPKVDMGSLVGAMNASEGVERPLVREDVQASTGEEGGVDGGVDKPRGPQEEKKRKPRARVRFGGDEEVLPDVQAGQGEDTSGGDHGHTHLHAHSHSPGHSTARPVVRHDRPDLYEF